MTEHFFAPCPRGLEQVLADELGALGVKDHTVTPGGVAFSGPFETIYTVNLHSRIASRVLWRVAQAPYKVEKDLYTLAHATAWEKYFPPTHTLRVDVVATKSPLKSLKFATLTIKDGVCDRFRERDGVRPSIAKLGADARVFAYLDTTQATLYLDTSGEALFKRGYRVAEVEAPIRENLAAGILRLIGWTPEIPLYDPMCGSGTFLIEAAQIALGIPAGSNRRFGFYKFKQFDAPAWQRLRDIARQAAPQSLQVHGSDISQDALRAALANFTAGGVDEVIHIRSGDLLNMPAPTAARAPSPGIPSGIMVCNPPYGERLSDQETMAAFYPRLGDTLKKYYAGWNCHFISADRGMEKGLRLRSTRKIPLMNGDLDCRLYEFKVIAGSNRD